VSKPYHTPDAIEVTFDDENLVANAGLLLVSTLAQRLGLDALISERVDLTGRVGGANPASKSVTLIWLCPDSCANSTSELICLWWPWYLGIISKLEPQGGRP
jgi:hypothetical protein